MSDRQATESDLVTNGDGNYIGDVLRQRVSRRAALKGAGALGVGLVVANGASSVAGAAGSAPSTGAPSTVGRWDDPGRHIRFEPIAPSSADAVVVPKNYAANVVLKWGDPLFSGAPAFDVNHQTRATQEQQFGFNCDFIGFYPLGWRRGLLAVNHEYTTGLDMFPGYDADAPTTDQVDAEIAAHGMTVAEIREQRWGGWKFKQRSRFNRRITGFTPIEITGPLRGHPLLATSADPGATTVLGMFNNCAGGKTPWGTVLTCEENFDQYFANEPGDAPNARIPAEDGATDRRWEDVYDRFDRAKEPNEYHRFGYVVEIDPYNPNSKPRKRTAMGRFKHEGAVPAITESGQVAVYSGDDARFEYVYKFITDGTYDRRNRYANIDIFDTGTLYVAKLHADGTGEWIPLPKDAESLLNTRGAADAVGATKMDRPEDVDVSPVTNKVYIAMTNNTNRDVVAADPGEVAANPRLENEWGHIIEITEDGDDNGALTFRWEVFMLCGDPSQQGGITDLADLPADTGENIPGIPDAAYFAGFDPSLVSPIAAPDNLVIDRHGNLWIATDGQPGKPFFGQNDGVFAVPTEGPHRGYCRQFLSGVPGGEVCGPEFSTDGLTFFCGIQHPGEDGGLPNSVSAWPDGNAPAKPGVLSVWHKRRRPIGSG